MPYKTINMSKEQSTEQKIIDAADKIFTQKGYAAARTRDIAEEAGINLALLNYYFRSKKKLFQLVMTEKLTQFLSVLLPIVDNEKLDLDEKLEILTENYFKLLTENPQLPVFIINEIQTNPDEYQIKTLINEVLKNSSLMKQIKERSPETDPIQIFTSLLGLAIFPFIAKPLFFNDEEEFRQKMEERKKLVIKWVHAIIDS